MNVVFHEDEEDDPGIGGRGDGGGHGKEGMVAQDDEDIVDEDEDEGMEADYDEVLKTAVSQLWGGGGGGGLQRGGGYRILRREK